MRGVVALSMLDGFPDPGRALPAWLTEEDIDVYASAYMRTGLGGILGFYRNLDADHQALKPAYQSRAVSQPALFIGGAVEPAVRFGSFEPMKAALPNLRGVLVLPGCGHWVQQERAAETNAAIIEFLDPVP